MHLSGVPEVLYNTVLWLCECSGLESALSLKCMASRYLYHILKSVLPCHYSCFLIEYHFCGCSSDNEIHVTWDVKSLYTSIPHKDGLEALKKTLEEEDVYKSKATTILDFSKLVLTSKYFQFSWPILFTKIWYKMAPSYANIFIEQFEKNASFISTQTLSLFQIYK